MLALSVLLILLSALTVVSPIPVFGEIMFTPETQFAIPEYNSFISFAAGGSYSNASLIDNIWYFKGLILEGGKSSIDAPFFAGIRFSVSAHNSNIIFTRLDALIIYPPYSGWIEYTLSGVGNQQINLNYSHPEWLSYRVYIDGEEKEQNNGWTVTNDGWITVNGATSNVKILYERASGTFTPLDIFEIPEYNSSINFAFNGSYVYTNFTDNIWRFQNLIVNDYGTSFNPRWYLSASARNCNVMITSYHAPFTSSGFKGWINYIVTGVGNQTFDNNYDKLESRVSNNYTVIIDGIVRQQNDGWVLNDDGWLTVAVAKSNVTIFYEYVHVGPYPPEPGSSIKPLLLFNIPIALFLVIIAIPALVVVALVILYRRKQHKTNRIGDSQ